MKIGNSENQELVYCALQNYPVLLGRLFVELSDWQFSVFMRKGRSHNDFTSYRLNVHLELVVPEDRDVSPGRYLVKCKVESARG